MAEESRGARFCTNCGKQLLQEADFCPSCGTRQSGLSASAANVGPNVGQGNSGGPVNAGFSGTGLQALGYGLWAAILMMLFIPYGWGVSVLSGWFVNNLKFSDGRTARFTGSGSQIWYYIFGFLAASLLNEFSGHQFCGNCGVPVVPGEPACNSCGSPIQSEENTQEISGDYIPYCRACGVPVAREAALHCTKCGVTPLCHEHFYPSTRSCALCPPFEMTPEEQESSSLPTRPSRPRGPWPQPAAAVACPQCGARIRQGVEFCPNCGAEQQNTSEEPQCAGFLIRLGAAIIDSLITLIPAAIISSVIDLPALGSIISVIYYVIFTYYKGQTPGKMLLGLHVQDQHGNTPNLKQVLLREVIGKAISVLALLIGYLWIIWDPKKRGWHDHLSGTYVVKRGKN
ncbi:MAG: RDD family protein [Chloroflexi bacterium]|nr:RDD family protein [Chloroflexota bacterium]